MVSNITLPYFLLWKLITKTHRQNFPQNSINLSAPVLSQPIFGVNHKTLRELPCWESFHWTILWEAIDPWWNKVRMRSISSTKSQLNNVYMIHPGLLNLQFGYDFPLSVDFSSRRLSSCRYFRMNGPFYPHPTICVHLLFRDNKVGKRTMAQLSAQRNVRRNLGWRSLEPIGTPCAWLLPSKFAKYPTEVKTCFTIHLRWFKGKEKHLAFKSQSPAAICQLCLTNFYHELIITHYNHYMQRHSLQIGQFDQRHFWKTKLVYSNLSIATVHLW